MKIIPVILTFIAFFFSACDHQDIVEENEPRNSLPVVEITPSTSVVNHPQVDFLAP